MAPAGEQLQLLCALFTVLDALSKTRDEMAPVLYRTLVSLYVNVQDLADGVLKDHMHLLFFEFFRTSKAPVAIFGLEFQRSGRDAMDMGELGFVQKLAGLG